MMSHTAPCRMDGMNCCWCAGLLSTAKAIGLMDYAEERERWKSWYRNKRAEFPITVLGLSERLDGSNYTQLITRAQEEYTAGARDFLLDLGEVTI